MNAMGNSQQTSKRSAAEYSHDDNRQTVYSCDRDNQLRDDAAGWSGHTQRCVDDRVVMLSVHIPGAEFDDLDETRSLPRSLSWPVLSTNLRASADSVKRRSSSDDDDTSQQLADMYVDHLPSSTPHAVPDEGLLDRDIVNNDLTDSTNTPESTSRHDIQRETATSSSVASVLTGSCCGCCDRDPPKCCARRQRTC